MNASRRSGKGTPVRRIALIVSLVAAAALIGFAISKYAPSLMQTIIRMHGGE